MHPMINTDPGLKALLLTVIALVMLACAQNEPQTLITIADARSSPARFVDSGEPGDSVGDLLTFDQPLLDEDMQEIGNNSGTCVRTRVAHSFQCQWTLTLADGTIQVAGREFDRGTSVLSITGGTGNYTGISGEMESINNNDGTFTQKLRYRLNAGHKQRAPAPIDTP
jgi:hypothetical protein